MNKLLSTIAILVGVALVPTLVSIFILNPNTPNFTEVHKARVNEAEITYEVNDLSTLTNVLNTGKKVKAPTNLGTPKLELEIDATQYQLYTGKKYYLIGKENFSFSATNGKRLLQIIQANKPKK